MKSARKLLIIGAGSVVFIASNAISATAQTPVDPSTTPTENTGGWVFSMAQLMAVLGVAIVLFLVVMYMRYAPRFAKDEEGLKVVRADRVRPGEDVASAGGRHLAGGPRRGGAPSRARRRGGRCRSGCRRGRRTRLR